MSGRITLLVGTMTGTAELVAEEVAGMLRASDRDVEVRSMDGLDAAAFTRDSAYLIVSSTYGNGDVPDNAQAFFGSLAAARPDLSHVVYGVIALGDMTYKATFCNGGRQFDGLLQALGATRAGEPLLHDASSGVLAEDAACEWAQAWLDGDLEQSLAA